MRRFFQAEAEREAGLSERGRKEGTDTGAQRQQIDAKPGPSGSRFTEGKKEDAEK